MGLSIADCGFWIERQGAWCMGHGVQGLSIADFGFRIETWRYFAFNQFVDYFLNFVGNSDEFVKSRILSRLAGCGVLYFAFLTFYEIINSTLLN